MLRTDMNAGFVAEGAWLWKRHRFQAGKLAAARPLGRRALAELAGLQCEQPVALIQAGARRWWWFRDCFYWEDEGLAAVDVMALVLERERRKRRKLERAHAAMRGERGGARCVECGSDFELQYDHVIPFSMGGAATAENLQLLCASCNRVKGAAL